MLTNVGKEKGSQVVWTKPFPFCLCSLEASGAVVLKKYKTYLATQYSYVQDYQASYYQRESV